MFHMFDANTDKGCTGWFDCHPQGAFTILTNGRGWVTNDLQRMDQTARVGWGPDDVARAALVQGF